MAWWRKKKPNKKKPNFEREAKLLEEAIKCCDGKSNPIKFFSADEIRKATDNFSESNHVSEIYDYEYKWYSGKNEMILIKKARLRWYMGYLRGNFCRDIAVSSMVSGHKNFLKLVGCCLEFEFPVVVYHGVKKHYHLVLKEQPWKRRMKIAEDIATALAYLHTAFPRPFVYRSLSIENILLDEDGVAKLRDFSYCVSIPKGEKFVKVESVVGFYSYMEFNSEMNRVVSEETDVFAIGLLMQMLLTREKRFDVLNWVSRYKEKRRMEEIADPEMLEKMGEISEEELFQMKAFLMLSHRCIGLRGEVPTMVEVAKELKKIQRSLRNDDCSSPSGS